MAASKHEVLCITKSQKKITHIGGKNADEKNWKITEKDAIEAIENKKWEFYVTKGGKEVEVIIATQNIAPYEKYLKTKGDDTTENNLLSLPNCP